MAKVKDLVMAAMDKIQCPTPHEGSRRVRWQIMRVGCCEGCQRTYTPLDMAELALQQVDVELTVTRKGK